MGNLIFKIMGKYVSHRNMRSHMRKVKKFGDSARIMGIDVGRKYTGLGMSDKELKVSVPFRTLFSDAQYTKSSVNLAKYDPMFHELQKIIKRKNVKGIVVGYPFGCKRAAAAALQLHRTLDRAHVVYWCRQEDPSHSGERIQLNHGGQDPHR